MKIRKLMTMAVLMIPAMSGFAVSSNPVSQYLDKGYAIAPDKQSKAYVMFDASKASTSDKKTATAWSFKLTDGDSAFQSTMGGSNGPLTNPDEAKFRDGGRTLLVTGSWLSGWAEIDVATKKVRRYAKTGTTSASLNTHSIEKLPDGSLVVANSTGSADFNNALVLITTDANGNHTYKKLFSLYGAHGVEWDEARNCLWACGNSSSSYSGRATLYKLTYDPVAKTLTQVDSIQYRTESSTTAHALRLSANGMIYCSAGDIYKVNPDTKAIEKTTTTAQTKGVHFDSTYGMVYQISGYLPEAGDDEFLNDHVTVVPISGEAYDVYPSGATRMYKVGWASAWPAMFVPYISNGESFWCGGDGSTTDANWVNDVRTDAKAVLKSGNKLVFGGYESPDITIGSATTVAGISAAHGTTTLAGSALTLTAGIETIDSDAVVVIKGPVSGPITKTGKGTLVLEGDISGITMMNVQAGTVAISNSLPASVTASVCSGATLIMPTSGDEPGGDEPIGDDPVVDPPSGKPATIDSYVQSGLVANWDGIQKGVDPGVYNGQITVWKDLIGDYAIKVTNALATAKGFLMRMTDNKVRCGWADHTEIYKFLGTTTKDFNYTVEVVASLDNGSNNKTLLKAPCNYSTVQARFFFGLCFLFDGGSPWISTCPSTQRNEKNCPGVGFGNGSTNVYTVVYTNCIRKALYCNGVEVVPPDGAPTKIISSQSEPMYVGCNGFTPTAITGSMEGSFCALRFYNRVLTEKEITANVTVDLERYCGIVPKREAVGAMMYLW